MRCFGDKQDIIEEEEESSIPGMREKWSSWRQQQEVKRMTITHEAENRAGSLYYSAGLLARALI